MVGIPLSGLPLYTGLSDDVWKLWHHHTVVYVQTDVLAFIPKV